MLPTDWGYDVHFAHRYTKEELYAPVVPAAHFRMLLCPDERAEAMLQAALPVPQVEYNGWSELPLYSRSSSFESGMDLREPTTGATDPWPWYPSTAPGGGCEWCRDEGRSDSNSLKISKQDDGAAEWMYQWEGDGGFTDTWSSGRKYRVSVWAKTADVVGRGASLAVN